MLSKLELLWILNGRQVLLLLIKIVLVNLFLELDVLLVNSVDLLPQVFVLPFESFNELVLVLDFLNLFVIHVSLNLDLVSKRNQLLSFKNNLHVVILFSVTRRLAFFCFERSLSYLN